MSSLLTNGFEARSLWYLAPEKVEIRSDLLTTMPDGSVRGAARNLETGELTPATLLDFNQIREEDSED